MLKANPEGLIPTLVDEKGRAVHESLVTIEYVDELAARSGDPAERATPLLPTDPAERARCRLAMDWVNRKLCSPYYTMLVRTDPGERRAAFDTLLEDIATFSRDRQGTFYCGDTLSAPDVAFLPWASRFYILEHYRNFVIPDEGDLKGYHEWLRAALALPEVARTMPDRARYLEHIGRYADASARSKVSPTRSRPVALRALVRARIGELSADSIAGLTHAPAHFPPALPFRVPPAGPLAAPARWPMPCAPAVRRTTCSATTEARCGGARRSSRARRGTCAGSSPGARPRTHGTKEQEQN